MIWTIFNLPYLRMVLHKLQFVFQKIFEIYQQLFNNSKLSPLYRWCTCVSSFEQTWINFTQWCFVPSLVEIGPVVLEKMFMTTTTTKTSQRRRQTTDILIGEAHLRLRWAKIIENILSWFPVFSWLQIGYYDLFLISILYLISRIQSA